MVWKGFKDKQATIIIDLNKTKEELWKALKKTARKNIKRALSYNLEFKESNNWEKFYPIYRDTWHRGGNNPESLEKIKKYKLFLAYYKNTLVGGGAIDINNKILKFIAIAVSEKYLDMQVYAFIYWNLILFAKDNNLRKVDLGGYQLSAKLGSKLYYVNRFKEKWGGEIKIYNVYSKNPLYVLGRKAIKKSETAKWFWDRAKGRPIRKKKEYNRL